MTTLPALSTPCIWNTFLARSTPMVLTCIWTTPSGDSLFNDPLWHIRCRERASSTTSKAAVAAGLPDVGLPPDSGGMADIPQPRLRATTDIARPFQGSTQHVLQTAT